MNVSFTKYAELPDGEPLYRLAIDGVPAGDGLTIDQVVELINRRDELILGDDHVKGGAACAT